MNRIVHFNKPAKIALTLYMYNKYTTLDNPCIKGGLSNVIAINLADGKNAADMFKMSHSRLMCESNIDPNEEYLVFHFTDGEKAFFRNSYTDVCIMI